MYCGVLVIHHPSCLPICNICHEKTATEKPVPPGLLKRKNRVENWYLWLLLIDAGFAFNILQFTLRRKTGETIVCILLSIVAVVLHQKLRQMEKQIQKIREGI